MWHWDPGTGKSLRLMSFGYVYLILASRASIDKFTMSSHAYLACSTGVERTPGPFIRVADEDLTWESVQVPHWASMTGQFSRPSWPGLSNHPLHTTPLHPLYCSGAAFRRRGEKFFELACNQFSLVLVCKTRVGSVKRPLFFVWQVLILYMAHTFNLDKLECKWETSFLYGPKQFDLTVKAECLFFFVVVCTFLYSSSCGPSERSFSVDTHTLGAIHTLLV